MSQRTYQVQDPLQGEEWHPVDAWSAAGAAERYAEDADSDSGGEFQDNTEVVVKGPEGEEDVPEHYTVSVSYEKIFYVHRKAAPPDHGMGTADEGLMS